MRFTIPILLFISILYSCQHTLEKPDDLLSKNKFTEILTDIYLYKQSPTEVYVTDQTNFDTYVSIFKKHHTTKEIFQASFNYYYVSPKMDDIYKEVIENLKTKLTKDQLKKLKQEEKMKNEEASKEIEK